MAVFLCRYRRILLVLCTPFIMVLCLFVYVTLVVCLTMAQTSLPFVPLGTSSLETYFIAKGSSVDGVQAPHPEQPYWREKLIKDGFWNSIQHIMDRQHNPILQFRTKKSLSMYHSDKSTSVSTHSQFACQPNYEVMWSMPDYFNLTPELQRFILSMHCRNYPLLIDQPAICPSTLAESPMLLLAIKSQVKNFENRQAIRQTWGRSGLVQGQKGMGGTVWRVFLLARSDGLENSEELMHLEKESKTYGDIIMWDFMDTFFNLTLKDVLFWQWFSEHCQNARFVFKGDDDVFVRTPALLDYLQTEEEVRLRTPDNHMKMEDFVAGDVIKFAIPIRSKANKYYISESFYKGMYPTYAGGGGVIYSGALVLRLLQVSMRVHLFPIDDVYVGMCLQRLGVIPIVHPAFLTFDFTDDEAKDPCAHHTILLVHKRSPSQLLKLWTESLIPSPHCIQTTLRVKVQPKKIAKLKRMARKLVKEPVLSKKSQRRF
ncbi:N-acetyllactosaminide beta-1,3-N-acetylglucosaminyltransferase 2 [Brachyhypopomus gauderio]|uniref:N-acetyllactosaminide beta-1,3-N-acetylglucosaminyltransferase 2 n=1 Tax=Brachyhypopomus gauderio TaxID=698409 RepID=UPI00404212F2